LPPLPFQRPTLWLTFVERAEALAEAVDGLTYAEVRLSKHVVLELGGSFGDLGIYKPSEYERPTLRFCNAAKLWLPSVLIKRMSKESSLGVTVADSDPDLSVVHTSPVETEASLGGRSSDTAQRQVHVGARRSSA